MADINLPFASSASDRRVPSAQELLTGNACGNADRELHNFLWWYSTGQIAEVIRQGGLTPDDADLTQLYDAIRNIAPLISANVTINVAPSGVTNPADPFSGDAFNNLSNCFNWLRQYRIRPDVMVDVAVATGTYSETDPEGLDLSHPDGQNIEVRGNTLTGIFPDGAVDLAATSAGPFEATLRTIFPTVIESAVEGIITGRAGIRRIRNLLVIGPGVNFGCSVGTTPEFVDATFAGTGGSNTTLLYCWFQNFGTGLLARSGSHLELFHVGSTFHSGSGALANNGSYIRGKDVTCSQNGNTGCFVRDWSFAEFEGTCSFDGNANAGIRAVQAGARLLGDVSTPINIRGNGNTNLSLDQSRIYGSYTNTNKQSVSVNSAVANNGSFLELNNGSGSADLTPAAGVIGNNNSMIIETT